MNKEIQIMVITGQPLPNLIPVLISRPNKILCLASEEMIPKSELFKKTVINCGYKHEDILIERFDTSESLQKDIDYLIDIFGKLEAQFSNYSFQLNLTGGTKLITLACYEAFQVLANNNNGAFYVDSTHNRIQIVLPKNTPSKKIESVLDIPKLLNANDLSLRGFIDKDHRDFSDIQDRFKKITNYLIKNFDSLDTFFGVVNTQLNDDNLSALISFKHRPNEKIRLLLDKLEYSSLISIEDACSFRARNKKAADYLKGGWLEEFVFISAIEFGFEHVFMNVNMLAGKTKDEVRNEMDVCIVHHNQMTFIECKSGWINKSKKDADTVYKLDSLAEKAGGLMARKVLVSARELDHTNKQKMRVNTSKRAQLHEIITVEKDQLKDLHSIFTLWQ